MEFEWGWGFSNLKLVVTNRTRAGGHPLEVVEENRVMRPPPCRSGGTIADSWWRMEGKGADNLPFGNLSVKRFVPAEGERMDLEEMGTDLGQGCAGKKIGVKLRRRRFFRSTTVYLSKKQSGSPEGGPYTGYTD